MATSGITMALVLSVALLVYATDPWQRLFAATRGAHVWLRVDAGADTSTLGQLPGVAEVAGPVPTVAAALRHGADKAPVEIRAAAEDPSPVGRPQLVAGRWLDRADSQPSHSAQSAPAGVVLERSVAAALWVRTGDRLEVSDGVSTLLLRVVGVAQTAEAPYTAGGAPGIVWAPPALVSALGADGNKVSQTVGLRLTTPSDTSYLVQRAVVEVGSDKVLDVSTWREARANAEGDNHLLGLLLGFFGLAALLAAAIAATGGIFMRVRGQERDVSLLKAIGFTPKQVAAMFLLQHVALAALGVGGGVAVTEALGSRLPGPLGQAMALWASFPSRTWTVLGISGAAVFVIGCAAGVAGWRAARYPVIPIVRAAVSVRHRMSGAARAALRLRIPVALVLGARAVVNRPAQSAAAALRLAVPVLMISTALGTWATVDSIQHDPARVGLAGQLIARPNGLADKPAQRLLSDRPEIVAARPGVELDALAPGQTQTVTLRGVGTAGHSYPYAIVEGRAPARSDEAVAGQGLLDTLGVHVGQWIRVTVGSTPFILHLVGRCIETADEGRVISTSYDTLRDQQPALSPGFFDLQLDRGVKPLAEMNALVAAAHGGLEVRQVSDPPLTELSPLRGMILGLLLLLALVTLVELFTTIATAVRSHKGDLRAYRAIGLTPRQTVGTMVTTTVLVAIAAATGGGLLGVPFSRFLVDLVGRSSGLGAGIAVTPPWPVLVFLPFGIALAAGSTCLLPACRAVARPDDRSPALIG
ncbi:FtsX-like permease family protein [Streptomyces sp. NPDC054775]